MVKWSKVPLLSEELHRLDSGWERERSIWLMVYSLVGRPQPGTGPQPRVAGQHNFDSKGL